MRIGFDIASIILKHQADLIVLVPGIRVSLRRRNSPGGKACSSSSIRSGRTFPSELLEQIDGLRSGFPRPRGGHHGWRTCEGVPGDDDGNTAFDRRPDRAPGTPSPPPVMRLASAVQDGKGLRRSELGRSPPEAPVRLREGPTARFTALMRRGAETGKTASERGFPPQPGYACRRRCRGFRTRVRFPPALPRWG